MITVSYNQSPYQPLIDPITDVVFLTLPAFKDVCLHILEKYAITDIRYHFVFDRAMLHTILPNLDHRTSLLISLGNSVILTREELDCFTHAYNFHPAPPEYPGSHPYHFALMEGESLYGATCHQMDEYIDHGPIIYVERFDITPEDTSMTLLQKSLHRLFSMMERLFDLLLNEHHAPLPQGAHWGHRMFTEKKFNQLCQLSSSMTKDEFEQRYKSLQNDVENKNLVLHFHGHTFRYEGPVTANIVDLFASTEDDKSNETPQNEHPESILQHAG